MLGQSSLRYALVFLHLAIAQLVAAEMARADVYYGFTLMDPATDSTWEPHRHIDKR